MCVLGEPWSPLRICSITKMETVPSTSWGNVKRRYKSPSGQWVGFSHSQRPALFGIWPWGNCPQFCVPSLRLYHPVIIHPFWRECQLLKAGVPKRSQLLSPWRSWAAHFLHTQTLPPKCHEDPHLPPSKPVPKKEREDPSYLIWKVSTMEMALFCCTHFRKDQTGGSTKCQSSEGKLRAGGKRQAARRGGLRLSPGNQFGQDEHSVQGRTICPHPPAAAWKMSLGRSLADTAVQSETSANGVMYSPLPP